jgi:hypothetical protein
MIGNRFSRNRLTVANSKDRAVFARFWGFWLPAEIFETSEKLISTATTMIKDWRLMETKDQDVL